MEPHAPRIEVLQPSPEDCAPAAPPEGNVKLRNYRMLSDHVRAYTPTGDVDTSPAKRKQVARYDVCGSLATPRARILELVRPDDPGGAALHAIVRAAPRRGLARPLDDDTRRFLQRALLSPSPQLSHAATPEPPPSPEPPEPGPGPGPRAGEGQSLADELREAERPGRRGGSRQEVLREFRRGAEAAERERLGRLARAVELDDAAPGAAGAVGAAGAAGLGAAARRLDALLAESRALHDELAGIHEDIQAWSLRAARGAAAVRALGAEAAAARYLDDVVLLLRGQEAAAVRARRWPFAQGPRDPARNYVV